MALFSVGGLASGIDTKSLIEQLISAERAPARLAESKRSSTQARLDAIKAMNTRLLTLRDTMDAVEQSSAFAVRKATSSNESVLTASAGSAAVAGSMTVNVKRLASAHQLTTAPQGSATTVLGASGSITIRAAGATADTIVSVTDYSLNGIAAAINGANAGVTAGVVNDGTGYRLLVTSQKSGDDFGIATLGGDGDLAALLPGVGGMTVVAQARDAQVRLGDPATGLLLESATNTMGEAIPGVTLTLKAVGDGVNVTVSQDAPGVRASVQKMVDAYNDARAYFSSNSRFDSTTKRSGALFNEYDIPRQLDAIERELTASYTAQPTGFQSLAEIGVKLGSDGKLSIDATLFDAKLAQNQGAVANLFLAAGSATSAPLESLTRSVDGAMALKQSNLEGDIKSLSDRIASIDARLERRRAFYQAKFLEMEKLTAQFQSQGNAITNFATSLSGSSKK